MSEPVLFDFNRSADNGHLTRAIHDDLLMHLYPASHSVAGLYFTTGDNVQIDIPDDIRVYTKYEVGDMSILVPPTGRNMYALCWSDDYIVVRNGVTVWMMHSQRAFLVS